MEKYIIVSPKSNYNGLVIGRNYYYKCSSGDLSQEQCYLEFLQLPNPQTHLLVDKPFDGEIDCVDGKTVPSSRPTTIPVTTQPPVTTSPGSTTVPPTTQRPTTQRPTTQPATTVQGCTLSIVDVATYPEPEYIHLRKINLAGYALGVRNFRLTFKGTDGIIISSRIVDNLDTSQVNYLIFRESSDGMNTNGTYVVEIVDLAILNCVATKQFTITSYSNGTTTSPVTTQGPITTQPPTTLPQSSGTLIASSFPTSI